jgi:hypothetical protein
MCCWEMKRDIPIGAILGDAKVTKNASRPATTFYGTVALSFVIPTGAEGPAVLRIFRGDAFRQGVA